MSRICAAASGLAISLMLAGCAGGGAARDGMGTELTEAQIDEVERIDLPIRMTINEQRRMDAALAADARLLYVTGFESGKAKDSADPVGSPIMRTLEIGNLAAWAFDSPLQLEAPWATLLSFGLPSAQEDIKSGYRYGTTILSRPSLTLVGHARAAGAEIGTPAYGAKMDALFRQGDALMRAAGLGCEPATKRMHTRTLRGELVTTSDNWSVWRPNIARTRKYTCARIAGDPTQKDNLNQLAVYPSPQDREAVRESLGMMGMTGTITVADDPIVLVTFHDLTKYPGHGGNDAAWTLLEKIQDQIPEGWHFVIGGSLPGEPSGPMQVVVGKKGPAGFQVARYEP